MTGISQCLFSYDKELSKLHKQCLALFTFVCLGISLSAQTVSGTIISENDGSALIGATVNEKGTINGTITDLDGNFSLQLRNSPATLEISFTGFSTKEVVVVGGQTGIEISLAEGAMLEEVVVSAFGITKERKALPYSVTQIDGSSVQEVRTANLGNALTGKIAGVNITPPASGAGGSTRITIRGGSSLSGNDQPLFVVNGVPTESGNFGQAGLWGGNDGGDGLAMFNPDDIESISVLKGNTAAALYGARAANGVILVTTKSGAKSQGLGITFNSNITTDRAIDQTQFQEVYGQGLRGSRFMTQEEALVSATSHWGERHDGRNTVQWDGVQRPYSPTGETINDFYRTGVTINNSLAFAGGNERGNYRIAVSDLSNADIMPNASFRRNTANLNLTSVHSKLTLNLAAQYTHQNAKNRPRLSDSPGNANFAVTMKPRAVPFSSFEGNPNKPGAREDGQELRYQGNTFSTNPYWAAYQFFRSDVTNRLVGNMSAKYDVTDWLYVMGRVGTDFTNRDAASSEAYGTAYKPRGDYSESFTNVIQNNYELFIGGVKTVDKLSFDYMVGASMTRSQFEQKGAGGNDLVVPFLHSLNNVAAPNRIFGFSESGINSMFGNLTIGYDNWLYFNLTGRQDKFSTLSPDRNSLFYPSAGISAVISDVIDLPSAITFAKFRTSWAQVGGGAPNPYSLNLTYGLTGQGHAGANLGVINNGSIPNQNLQPFTSTEIELGLDLRFLDNRLGLDIAYYNRKTDNDILNAGISATSGFGSTIVNVGQLANRGVELLFSVTPIKKRDLSWDLALNYAHNISEAVNLGNNAAENPIQFLNLQSSRVLGGEVIRHTLGQPLGLIVGRTHRTNAAGVPMYSADGIPVRSDDFSILGEGRHPISAGLINNFTYKGFRMSFLIDIRQGGSMFSGTNWLAYRLGLHEATLEGRESGIQARGVLPDGETPVNVTVPVDRLADYWVGYSNITENLVYDASFGKLREFSLGYTIPGKMLNKTPFRSLSIQLVGRNLALLWSKIPNVDPESGYTVAGGAQGLEFFAMPQTRNFGINLSANF